MNRRRQTARSETVRGDDATGEIIASKIGAGVCLKIVLSVLSCVYFAAALLTATNKRQMFALYARIVELKLI